MSQAYLRQPDLKLRVQRSGIHGYGLFAQMSFEKNDVIVEYIGKTKN
jgi:SET domain-containing protein